MILLAFVGGFIPYLAVSSRRLHDTERTAWWILISLIPVIGAIAIIIFWAQKEVDGGNVCGPNPIS